MLARLAYQLPFQKVFNSKIEYSGEAKVIINLRVYPAKRPKRAKKQKKSCTYNSRYSLVVTDPTTNLPISGLYMAERTGCPILLSLWSYVTEMVDFVIINKNCRAVSKQKCSLQPLKDDLAIMQSTYNQQLA